MATVSYPLFNVYRSGTWAALQWLVHQQQWREQVVGLLQRRIARDRNALESTLEAWRGAQSWSDFGAATQTVWRDYLIGSAALWQESTAASVQVTGVWANAARDVMQQWQDAFAQLQPGTAAAAGAIGPVGTIDAAQPMREWMAAFERAMSAASSAFGTEAHSHGGQHGR
ncbi:hypothetical protein F4827_002509 [Paraburkholderia bannensis]|uniref:Uncharacterized protein n=1 Tax=Paraburkholderia bannensis TaxID=765414 RepID=A0A7W9WST9_9BURK|nr:MULTISPECIES: hypothetical protein [Paraburkholderia]MBB3257644.1 hypothetical protein [Paraburkholderia sp. WP4_3_2]MBB6102657.1 hypothetical protein [Paraburkholderia bannensis]